MKLSNRTILITGGATGIGFAMAQALTRQNNKVIITGRRLDKLQEAQQEIPSLLFFSCDVADPGQIDLLFLKLKQEGLVLDAVINNAGVIELWDIARQSISSTDIFNKLNTNLAGPIAITQHFIRQADPEKENYIINVTTEAAIMPIPILPLYSSSKAGLSVFTKSLRVQLKDSKFKVIEVVPPSVETKMTTEDLNNTTKLVQPADFVLAMLKNIEAGKLEFSPGFNALLLSFIRRFLPSAGLNIIDKISRKQLM